MSKLSFTFSLSPHAVNVATFMSWARQELPTGPTIPNSQIRKLRASLILEEALETIKALGFSLNGTELVETHEPDLAEIVDGCCDVRVVATGTLLACGVPDIAPQTCIDMSNLLKFGPGHSYREDGKLIKPPDWKKPDLKTLIETQEQIDYLGLLPKPVMAGG